MSNDPTKTDIEILILLHAGDRKSISLLIDTHFKPLFKGTRQLIGNDLDTEEIISDTFLVIWEKRSELNLTPPLRPYLFKIAHNKAINFLKLRNRKEATLIDMESEDLSKIASRAESETFRALNREIRAATRRLSPKTRIIFILSRQLKMSNLDIAQRLNISVKAVEKHMTKAIRLMRKWFSLVHLIMIYWTLKK